MKLTIIGPVFPYRGGIAHFTTLLTRNLREQGHDVQMVSFKKQYPQWLFPGKSDKDTGSGRVKVSAEYLLSPLNPFSWLRTFSAIKAFGPEMVVIQWWVTFWAPALGFLAKWLRRAGFPIEFIVHNTIPHEPRFFDPMLARFALKQGHQFIVMNNNEVQQLQDLLAANLDITQCPLPVFSAFPDLNITQQEAREELLLPVDKRLILFFGIIRPYKGLRDLLTAMGTLKEQGHDLGLIVAGEFWEDKDCYLNYIKALDISDRVWIVDRYITDRETSLYFKAANLFVAPYIDGTQSATVKTALGFGMPVVVTRFAADKIVKSLPELYRIVPEADPVCLAESILEMIEKPAASSETINRINETTWLRMTETVLSLKKKSDFKQV